MSMWWRLDRPPAHNVAAVVGNVDSKAAIFYSSLWTSQEANGDAVVINAGIAAVAVVVNNANSKAIIVTCYGPCTQRHGHCCCCCLFADRRAAIVTDTATTHALNDMGTVVVAFC